MHTPSLRIRLILTGAVTMAALLAALSAFVYLSLQRQLNEDLEEILGVRVALTRELAAVLPPEELRDRLASAGIPALIRPADGRVLRSDPATPRFQGGPPADPSLLPRPLLSREAPLPDGGSVTVFASRAGVDSTLRTVLLLEAVGSIVATSFALVLVSRFSTVILRRLDQVVATARRIAGGRAGERLRPDRPHTELGRLAAAFDEMLEALETAVADARAAESRSRRFLADAAHQLRTPVAGIRASVELLLDDPPTRDREHLRANLARESVRLTHLIESLLRVARLDSGTVPTAGSIDLLGVVRDEVARAAALAPSLEVVAELPVGSVAVVQADAAGVAEALANVLDNARRHAVSSITVTLTTDRDRVEVRVVDDGVGVGPGDEERIFERFLTLDGHGGSGLGLPIARALVRLHDGDLVYRGGGFVLTLPRAAAAAGSGSEESPQAAVH